jgi:hypothetical protein
MISIKPEPVSAIFLPKIEQNIPFPLRLVVVELDVDITETFFIL